MEVEEFSSLPSVQRLLVKSSTQTFIQQKYIHTFEETKMTEFPACVIVNLFSLSLKLFLYSILEGGALSTLRFLHTVFQYDPATPNSNPGPRLHKSGAPPVL